MINIEYNDNIITLFQKSESEYEVCLKNDLVLPSFEDVTLDTSIKLIFDKLYENVLFNGAIADDSETYDNIFVPSNIYKMTSEDISNLKIYFYNGDKNSITIPAGKSIGTLEFYISYSNNYECIIDENQDTKIIYDMNGLKVISTDESTHDINRTEMEIDSDGNKVLKIYYPSADSSEELEKNETE